MLAALILVGQAVARYASAAVAELLVLRAVGLTRRQAAASVALAPGLAAAVGATLGVGGAIVASNWMPIGEASLAEPSPGIDADWLVLGVGWAAAVLLVASAATAVIAWTALRGGSAGPRPQVRHGQRPRCGRACRCPPWWARASRSRPAAAAPPCRSARRSPARSPACSACWPR